MTERLPGDREQAFWSGVAEASRFFLGDSDVQRALERLARTLDEQHIPYAVIGAMALNEWGYRRVTVDVDILLSPEGLARFKGAVLGRGYVEKFPGSRGLRDAETGVTIDVVLAGEYPGDGKPKAVVFPIRRTPPSRASACHCYRFRSSSSSSSRRASARRTG